MSEPRGQEDASDKGSSRSDDDSEEELLEGALQYQILQAQMGQLSLGTVVKSQLSEPTVEALAKAIREGEIKKVVVMAGAGISVSAGIPDFRTPGTGLYDNLQKYNLPQPEAIFELGYFRRNPQPFFTLAKELFPGSYNATPAHYFIKFLADRGLLLRCYTQNIDGLEEVAGVPSELIVQVRKHRS